MRNWNSTLIFLFNGLLYLSTFALFSRFLSEGFVCYILVEPFKTIYLKVLNLYPRVKVLMVYDLQFELSNAFATSCPGLVSNALKSAYFQNVPMTLIMYLNPLFSLDN